MKTPKTRTEFENHMNLLVCDMKPIRSIRFYQAIRRVEFLPNSRWSFITIDTQVRLRVNMEATLRQERDTEFYH